MRLCLCKYKSGKGLPCWQCLAELAERYQQQEAAMEDEVVYQSPGMKALRDSILTGLGVLRCDPCGDMTYVDPRELAATQPKEKAAMAAKRFVRHKSGQGEKWELHGDGECDGYDWCVYGEDRSREYFLPKSEYLLVEPVKEWKDVTGECEACDGLSGWMIAHKGRYVSRDMGYRLKPMRGMRDNGFIENPPIGFCVEQLVEVEG